MNVKLLKLAALALLAVFAPATWAAWTLDNTYSTLSFVSIKATDIGEVHTFKRLSGGVTASGNASVTIDLASVETLIPIRNERMQEFLFETQIFPSATITTGLDPATLDALTAGAITNMAVEANLIIKEKSVPITAQITVAKVDGQTVMVSSLQPVVVSATTLGLTEGVEKLRELAGLPSISQAVPVSFVFTFRRNTD
jgi:polyisoprenoid-binding protein YceI